MIDSAIYQLSDVRKSHGSNFAIRIRQLDVRRGEVLALIGPTGAGKSTLLRILAGLEQPSDGDIRFDDAPLIATRLALTTRRRITMVHQSPVLLSGTVRANVEFGLRLRRVHDRTRDVNKVLDQLGLTSVATQSAQTLSGGQTQLVAVARALVIEPDVLLLDEPTAHLDPVHVERVEQTLRQYHQRSGSTIVWATHNLFQARRVADRTALLLDGRLVEVGPTEPLFDRPTDSRTTDFVQGRMLY